MTPKRIIYFGDPMCSWCYGFTNSIQELRARYGDRADIILVMGGLRPDGTHVVDDHYRNFLRRHWQEIGERTDQPFDLAILDETGWIYDTEKACRAVVTMRRLNPEIEWEFFAATQHGFYFHNHDPNDPASYARIAETFGMDAAVFLEAYADPASIAATQADFRRARDIGVNSFPTVLVEDENGLAALTVGYRPFSELAPPLERWLEQ
ncbi:DsbA family protein [Castellaniella sp.]|uniref:DsbA family protein n=1 Tax=Castellaniella sp. TaxID=1955812 RepID=UPI002AFFABCB|nr:DsbA family protein [Castellaniella sp.]